MNQRCRRFLAALSVMTITLMSGCNYSTTKGRPPESLNRGAFSSVDYKTVNENIFAPYCVSCHGSSGGVSVESYSDVINHLGAIGSEVIDAGSMPPSGRLPPELQALLRDWIAAGAPESVSSHPFPTPTPAPAPSPVATATPTPTSTPTPGVQPIFVSIKKNILEPRCISCHGAKYANQAYVSNPKNGLVSPGKPLSSALYKMVVRTDSKRMPPPKTGSALTAAQIKAIELWILNGAKD